MFSVEVHASVLKTLKKSDPKIRERVHEAIRVLSSEPVPAKHYDVTKLAGSDGLYRIRLSSFRMKYFVDWSGKRIQILEFERRDEHTYG